MSNFFDEQGRTRVYAEAYMRYVADENPRRTRLIGKRAISGWKLIGGHNVRFICFSSEQLEYFPAAEFLIKIG